jgi:hypothetical protein
MAGSYVIGGRTAIEGHAGKKDAVVTSRAATTVS